MFPFSEMQRQYNFQSENAVFDKLSRLTYRTFGQSLDVDFVCADPPTFELWYSHDMLQSAKPFATKLTATLETQADGVRVTVFTSTNKMFYVILLILLLSLISQVIKDFNITSFLVFALMLVGLVYWDRLAKSAALEKLEKILH